MKKHEISLMIFFGFCLIFSFIFSIKTFGENPYLVKNVSAMDPWGSLDSGTEIIGVDNTVYFLADDVVHGYELWKSDGTADGTVLLKDIYPGDSSSYPQFLTNVNGTLFFRATNGVTGDELWKSDGTEAGTVIVKDISSNEGSYPENLTNVNGILFFTADDGIHGRELWKSDGTGAGTVLIKDINSDPDSSYAPRYLVNVNGTLFFSAYTYNETNGCFTYELWKSDGTEVGTVLVKDVFNYDCNQDDLHAVQNLTNVNGILFFSAPVYSETYGILTGLYKSDGTESGTVLVTLFDFSAGENALSNFININGTLYFASIRGIEGTLYKSDGTEEGTIEVDYFFGGLANPYPLHFVNVNGMLYFRAWFGSQFWKSDGTEAGTILVKEFNEPSCFDYPTNVNGTLYFRAGNGDGTDIGDWDYEIWKSDGTEAGTVMIKDIYAGVLSSYPENCANVNGTLYFAANDGIHGTELWKSDGTEEGTVLVKNIYRSVEHWIANAGDTIYFAGSDGINGCELWKSDGTETGTVMVKDIIAGPTGSNPSYLTNVNGTLFFTIKDGLYERELWKSDGTEAQTSLVKAFNYDIYYYLTDIFPKYLTNVDGTLFFVSNSGDGSSGDELWKSDGTEAGTLLVKDIYSGHHSSNPSYLTSVNSKLFFVADNGINGCELWKSDGSGAGTVLVKDIYSGANGSSPFYLTDVNGTLFFIASDGTTGHELWQSDGTAGGTVLVKDIFTGTLSSDPNYLTNVNGSLFFAADDGTNGQELWKSDGTTAGTVMVKDICGGLSFSAPMDLANVNGTLFFTADDGAYGRELWKSDGTSSGTVLVIDIYSGLSSSNPHNLTYANGMLFFIADDGIHGDELWSSDGTQSGTYRRSDINPGPAFSDIQALTATTQQLLFSGPSEVLGDALWASTFYPSPICTTNNTAVDLEVCDHTGVRISWAQDPDSWNDGGTGVRTYSVIRDGVIIVDIIAYGITEYVDTTGENNKNYLYQVCYHNGYGMKASTAGAIASDWSITSPTISGPDPACQTASLGTQSYGSYQWYRNGSIISGATSQDYSAVAPGNYTVFVTDSKGCTATSPAFTVYSYPSTPAVTGPSTGCGNVELSTGSYASYQWIKDGSDISGATNQTYTATASGEYSVRAGNSGGCKVSSSGKTVTIYAMPAPIVSGDNACDSVTLSTGSFSAYQWIKGGVDIQGATNQTYLATESGTYNVRVTSTDGCIGTSADKIVTVYVNPSPDVLGNSYGCEPVELSTGTFSTYRWIRNGLDITGATSQNYTVTQSGIYSVRVSTSDGCTATSAGKAITIYSLPTPTISGDHFNVCPATSVLLTTEAFSTYQWYLDNVTIPGATAQSYNAKTSGNYRISVTNADGCFGTSAEHQVFIDFCAQSEVSPSDAVFPAKLVRDSGSSTGYYLYFQRLDTLDGYNIYEGDIVFPWDGYYHHDNKMGSVCGATVVDLGTGEMRAEIAPSDGNHYYLVTAYGGGTEGPSGFNSDDVEIDALQSTCSP